MSLKPSVTRKQPPRLLFGGILRTPQRLIKMIKPSSKKDLAHFSARLKWCQSQMKRVNPDNEKELAAEIAGIKKRIVSLQRLEKARAAKISRRAA